MSLIVRNTSFPAKVEISKGVLRAGVSAPSAKLSAVVVGSAGVMVIALLFFCWIVRTASDKSD